MFVKYCLTVFHFLTPKVFVNIFLLCSFFPCPEDVESLVVSYGNCWEPVLAQVSCAVGKLKIVL